jgi:polysaccharide biosynthesis/export protein
MTSGSKIGLGFVVVMLAGSLAFGQVVPDAAAKPAETSSMPDPATAGSTTGSAASANDAKFQTHDERYRIAPGDSFDVTFELSPEFNQTNVAVQPDGFVTLRGVGDLLVQGQTVPELVETIRGAYAKTLNDPLISVSLKDFEKPYFVADGQVGKPGKYDLRGTVTLTQAIAIAGGFTDKSRHSQVLLFRRVSSQWMHAQLIDVKKMEKSGKLTEDVRLRPGDMLFVPKNTLSKIEAFFPSASMGSFFRP